ncbi:hypothetical protein ACH5BF_05580 [Arcobacter sp. YIC-464]|uniref:hypothetical protein n=1 Tax=Arcobacter sp. YIC-464 TaxID=3376631 RepID=UPI003C202128
MKNLVNFKIAVFFSLLFFLSSNLFAQGYILNDDGLIDARAQEKINQIGNEVKTKLGVNIYVYTIKSLSLPEELPMKKKFEAIKNHENEILPALKKPYILLTAFIENTHVNLAYSEDSLKEIVDKDDILDGYVVPLLASKDKNTLFAKVSASMLNGYAAIADTLALNKNVKLETSIGNQGKVSSTIWRVFMYTIIVTGLLAYTYAVLRKRKS